MAIEAYAWRDEHFQRLNVKLAWEIAMMSRQRRVPSLKSLLSRKPARPLKGKELLERRSDFSRMASKSNLELINKARGKKNHG